METFFFYIYIGSIHIDPLQLLLLVLCLLSSLFVQNSMSSIFLHVVDTLLFQHMYVRMSNWINANLAI